MYHIKLDKRSQRSAKLICRGLNRCVEQSRDFNKITISQIIKEAMIGRATFYRLFDSKQDVLAYQCDQLFRNATKATIKSSDTDSARTLFLNCAQLCIRHNLLLEIIIKSHREQIIYYTLMKRLNLIKKHFNLANNLSDEQLDYFLADLTQLIIGTIGTWIRHGKQESAQELINTAANVTGIIYHSIK